MLKKPKQFLNRNRSIEYCNSVIKGFLQERRAARSLADYRREAGRQGLLPLEQDELRQALAQRLSRRGIAPTAKSKGQMHIFYAYGLSNWEWVLGAALREFGQVKEFEWAKAGYNYLSSDWLEVRDKMNREMLAAFRQAHAHKKIDVVFGYLSGYTMDPEILGEMARTGAVVFNFSLDDKLNFPGKIVDGRYTSVAALAEAVDLNLTNAPESIIKYMVHGGLAAFWPEAAWPESHKPYDLDFDFDVSFVGKRYGWRPKFFEKLRGKGIDVECFGSGWANGTLSDEQMVQLYSRSRINLGFAGVAHSRGLMCLKGRDFEVPASGGLYLTQDNPELRLVYKVGREIVTYKNVEDCAATISRLLADPKRAEKIRQDGYRRTLTEHTWGCRFEQIFQLAGLLEKNAPSDQAKQSKWQSEISNAL